MKILNTKQLKEADKFTIKNWNMSSLELMERAANQIFEWINEYLEAAPVRIHIFCGTGNNGGDGLAVARLLLKANYDVKVYIVNFSSKRSTDFLANYNRLQELKYRMVILNDENDFPCIEPQDVVIDAIFGQGLNRPATDWVAAIIRSINESNALKISVDIPSGLYMDKIPKNGEAIIEANTTLTFQLPKLPLLLPETGKYSQSWELLDIGLDEDYLYQAATDYYFITKQEVLPLYRPRKRFTHKNTFGHVLVVGGSYGKIGAAILSSEAALNSGAGLVTAYIPKCGYQIMQTALPEVMVLTSKHDEYISEIEFDVKPTVIAFGPGANTKEVTLNAFTRFLEENECPLVIDADGLNMLALKPELLEKLPPKTILTPHPGELKRLLGEWTDDLDKLEKAKQFSNKYNVILVIKGAYTITVYMGKYYINSTGNPGMATAGSGDVLTGIIAGLIAQEYEPLSAAIFGVYLHGRAGDMSAGKNSMPALTATEIIDFIGDAYLDLFEEI